jgi:hypothetical protein
MKMMKPRWRWILWCLGCDLQWRWLMNWAAPAEWFQPGAKLGEGKPF